MNSRIIDCRMNYAKQFSLIARVGVGLKNATKNK